MSQELHQDVSHPILPVYLPHFKPRCGPCSLNLGNHLPWLGWSSCPRPPVREHLDPAQPLSFFLSEWGPELMPRPLLGWMSRQ